MELTSGKRGPMRTEYIKTRYTREEMQATLDKLAQESPSHPAVDTLRFLLEVWDDVELGGCTGQYPSFAKGVENQCRNLTTKDSTNGYTCARCLENWR